MPRRWNTDLVLGIVFLVAAVLLVALWVPLDTETGILERVRRRVEIGDAMVPTMAGALLGLSSLLLIFRSIRGGENHRLTRGNLGFLLRLLLITAVAMAAMRWTGPLVVEIAGAGDYRVLRDTAPWKYAGYLTGGVILITGLIGLVERRLRWRAAAVALVIALFLALIYDLPFDDLLLPPNGDV